MRYLDPKNELPFKTIFAQKDLLKSFLNALLPLKEEQLIEELEILPAEKNPVSVVNNSSLEVKCKDKAGRQFVVKIHLTWHKSFEPWALFNMAKTFVRQAGNDKPHVRLQPVYTLCLIDDTFHLNLKEFYHHYELLSVDDSTDCLEGMELIYIELPKFRPDSLLEKKMAVLWLRFFTEVIDSNNRKQYIPEDLINNAYTGKALKLIEESCFTEGELEAYEKYWDLISIEKSLLSEAHEKGFKIGFKEGYEKELKKQEAKALKKKK